MPFRIIPDRSEAPEHFVQSSRAKGWDVFDDGDLRADFGNEPVELEPETASAPAKSGSSTGEADVLTGKSSADNVDGSNICPSQSPYILEDRHVRPMLAQHRAAVRLDLAERHGGHARALKTEAEATDAAEQVEHLHNFIRRME